MSIPASARQTSPAAMYRVLVSVASLCGLLIVAVVLLTEAPIRRNRAELLSESVLAVLPGAERSRSFTYDAASGFTAVAGLAPPLESIHAGYAANGSLIGVAIAGRAMGYADHIDALWGYDPEQRVTTGFVVLASRETPGLGDRIGLDPRFLANFDGLELSLDAAGEALAQAPVAVAEGRATKPWELDGITGATISSKAVARLLRDSAALWLPRLRLHGAQLMGGGAGD